MIVGAKCFAASDQRDRDAGIAGEVEVYIAGEDVSILVPLLAAITPGGLKLVATESWRLAADLRPVEEMSSSAPADTEESALGFDLDVRDLERGPHRRAERQSPAGWVDGVAIAQMLGQVHEAAALGVDRAAGGSKFPDCGSRAGVVRELLAVELRISATDVEPIQVGWQGIPHRREFDQLGAGLGQLFQVVGVVEAKLLVAGDTDASARLRPGMLLRRLPPLGPGGLEELVDGPVSLGPSKKLLAVVPTRFHIE